MLKNNLYTDRVIRVALRQWRAQHPESADRDPKRWIWVSGYLAEWLSQHIPVDYAMRSELTAREEQLGITEAEQQKPLK